MGRHIKNLRGAWNSAHWWAFGHRFRGDAAGALWWDYPIKQCLRQCQPFTCDMFRGIRHDVTECIIGAFHEATAGDVAVDVQIGSSLQPGTLSVIGIKTSNSAR